MWNFLVKTDYVKLLSVRFSVRFSVSCCSSHTGRTPAHISPHSSPWNLFMKHNQTCSRVGDPLCSALPHRSAPKDTLSEECLCFGVQVCRNTRRECCQDFFFFFFTSYRPGKEVGVMHSSGRQKGCESSLSAAPLVPLTPFFTASPSPHLYPVHFACSWHKALALLQKGVRGDCELKRDKAWGRVLINMFSHILPGSGILAGRRLWVSPSLSPSLCRFTACQRLRFEECPPAVNQRGTHEGEPVRSKHLYLSLT